MESAESVVPRSTRYARANPEKHRAYARAYYHRNKEKCKARLTAWRASNPEKAAAIEREQTLRKYGLTPGDFESRLAAQHHACAICRTSFTARPHVDHDHLTGKVRGLLCANCNTAIGKMRDCPTVLRNAAAYLEANL